MLFLSCSYSASSINDQNHKVFTTFLTALIGVISLSGGLTGFFLSSAKIIERLLLIIAALTLLAPDKLTDLIGLTLVGFVFFLQWRRKSY